LDKQAVATAAKQIAN